MNPEFMTLMQSERSDLSSFDKVELHELADELLLDDSAAIEQCVRFFEADTKGLWHGRARALMARSKSSCTVMRIYWPGVYGKEPCRRRRQHN